MPQNQARSPRRAGFLILLAAVVAASACGGDDGGAGEEAAPEPTTVTCSSTPSVTAGEIAVSARWNVGDERSFAIKSSREDNGKPVGGTTSRVTVRVLESSGTGSALEWDGGAALIDDTAFAGLEVDPAVLEKVTTLSRLRFVYETDGDGAFTGVRNLEEVRGRFNEALGLIDELVAEKLPAEQSASLREAMQRVISDDAALQATLAGELRILHGLYGYSGGVGETRQLQTQLGNPFGGESFPATQAIQVTEASDDAGCVAASIVVVPDPEETPRILSESIEALAQDQDMSAEQVRAELSGFEMRNTVDFAWDPSSTWVVSVDAEKRIAVGGQSRIDRTTVRPA